jgi:hypothetical protein
MAMFGPPTPLTRDDLIALLRRNFEPHWIEQLLSDPSSLSVFEGFIAVMLRIQEAYDIDFSVGPYILSAPGAAPATSVVRLQRPSGADVTIEVDQQFQDDRGAIWVPVAPYLIPASGGTQTVDVPIWTQRSGYFLNSFEPLTYQVVDELPDPNLIIVAGPDPAVDGTTPFLDDLGDERGYPRAPFEPDDTYRNRLVFLADMVAPGALARTIYQVLDGYPATTGIADLIARHGQVALVEPFRDGAQPSQLGLDGREYLYADALAFVDDPVTDVARSAVDFIAFFDVFLPTPVDPEEARQFFDLAEGDIGSFFDDTLMGYWNVSVGNAITAPIAALADELDRRRPGGVPFRIWLGRPVALLKHPEEGGLSQVGTWVDQDGVVTDAAITAALATFDADETYVRTGTGAGNAGLSVSDLYFERQVDPPAPDSVIRVVLRARVRRAGSAVGTDPQVRFLLRPTGAGAAIRVGVAQTINFETYREVVTVLEQNPVTAAAWTPAQVSGLLGFGIANVAAVGATDQLRVSELYLEIWASYG